MDDRGTHNYGNIKLMFDSMPYTCLLWNRDLVMLDCNDASLELFRVDSKEELKESFFEFSPEYQPDGKSSKDKAIDYLARAFKSGKCVFDWTHIASDGTQIPCSVTATRVDGKSEQLVVAHIIDMTDHFVMMKEIGQKDHLLYTVNNVAGILLQASADEFTESLYRCMGMIAGAVDADRVYMWKNHIEKGELCCSQIFEWSEKAPPQHGKGHTIGLSYRKDIPQWAKILVRGGHINGEVKKMPIGISTQLARQGIQSIFIAPVFLVDEFWGFIGFDDCHSARVFSDDEASILRSAGLLIANSMLKSDMTIKLKEALEKAQEASHAKSIFLSNMSHEIRTPMNAIIGMAELLVREQLNERQQGYAGDIIVSAKSLLDIINDILDFSKVESGKLELNPVDYDFAALIDNIESMFVYVAQKKGLEFKLECGKNVPEYLYGDDIRLRQVLINICGNAIKFTESGYVLLKISVSNNSLVFEIVDTGVGIRQEDMAKLFNAFEQVDKSINRSVVGTGLGLTLSRSFVEMMGGSISIESEYGHGSAFTIVIPVVKGNADNVESNVSGKAEQSLIAPDAKILVTDDNEFNLKVASGLLSLMDILPDTADSGHKAIELVKQRDYDIIFMDHMMPEMDGVEAVRRIRELGGKHAEQTIIALTANATGNAREMFLRNGFTDFISKPIDVKRLFEVVKKYLPPEIIREAIGGEGSQERSYLEDELLRKATVTFVKDNQNTFERITDALDEGDIETAHRIAHTLKSSAGYLGKKELQEAAFSIEDSLQSEKQRCTSHQLAILHEELVKALREFMPLYVEAQAEKKAAVRIDSEEMIAMFAELKPLLEKSDFNAADYVERLRGIAGMEQLAHLIDDYDFEGALKELESHFKA